MTKDNMKLWDAVSVTDPDTTRKVNQRGGFTAICAQAQLKEAIFKYGYHFQAAHYCDVFEAKQFFIIAVRNFEPYETMVYEVPPALIEEAREINHDTLRQIRDCRELGTWHSPNWGKVITLEKDYDKR